MDSFHILKNTQLNLFILLLLILFSIPCWAAQEVVLGNYSQTEAAPKLTKSEIATPEASSNQEIILADALCSDEDWIWLKSGEFLIGSIENLYDDKLAFDSDDLGDLKIKWKDISRIRSRQLFTVHTINNGIITGTVILENGILTITNNRQHQIPQKELLTLIAGLENGINIWKGKITFGANLSTGNTDKLEYNTRAEISRHTTTSRIKAEYTAIIGETNNAKTDDNHRFAMTYDVYDNKNLFFRPIDLSLFRDPLQNVSSRVNWGMGLGYQFMDNSKQQLEMNLGPSYLYTKYEYADTQLKNSDSSLAVSITTNYKRKIHDKIELRLSYKLTATEKRLGGYLHNAQSNIDIELTDILDFDITFFWDRVDHPLADTNGNPLEKNDFKVSFGLGVAFN